MIMEGLFTIGNINLTIQTSACHSLHSFSCHFSYEISLLHGRSSQILLQIPAEAPFLIGIIQQWVKSIYRNFLCGHRIVQEGCSLPVSLPVKSCMSYIPVIILVYLFSHNLPLYVFTILLIVNKGVCGEFANVLRFSLSQFKWGEGV